MIELKNFCKDYKSPFNKKNSFSVKDISFCVKPGTITGLVGPNGSGKSTIIKAICQFHYQSSGKILITDDNQNKETKSDSSSISPMKLCGYVPEISCLPPDMKTIDFLYYAAQNHKIPVEKAAYIIENLTNDLFLSEFLDKRIKVLSKGQQQKVSFAQALIHNPSNLILDEPFTGLDPAQIIKFRNYIKDLGKTKSVLISSHILSEVTNLCSQAYIMYKGRLFKVNDLNNIEKEFLEITEDKQ